MKQFVEYNSTPLLSEHFAGIGVRKCQNYKGCNDYLGIDIEIDITKQIRNLYENASHFITI